MISLLYSFHDTTPFGQFTSLLEVVIWPVTLLAIIMLFKSNFQSAFERLGSFEANASGVSMTFQEVANQAKEVAQGLKPILIAKSGVKINNDVLNTNITPFAQVTQIQHNLEQTLKDLAESRGISSSGLNTTETARKLEEIGELSYKHTRLIQYIENLISISGKNITQSQANEISTLHTSLIN